MTVCLFHIEQANLQLYTTQPSLWVEERLAVTLFRYNKHLKISKVLFKMWSPPASLQHKAKDTKLTSWRMMKGKCRGAYRWFSLDVIAAMLVYRTIEKKSFGNLTLLLCKIRAIICYCFVHQHGRLITWLQTIYTFSMIACQHFTKWNVVKYREMKDFKGWTYRFITVSI